MFLLKDSKKLTSLKKSDNNSFHFSEKDRSIIDVDLIITLVLTHLFSNSAQTNLIRVFAALMNALKTTVNSCTV